MRAAQWCLVLVLHAFIHTPVEILAYSSVRVCVCVWLLLGVCGAYVVSEFSLWRRRQRERDRERERERETDRHRERQRETETHTETHTHTHTHIHTHATHSHARKHASTYRDNVESAECYLVLNPAVDRYPTEIKD